MRNGWRKMSTAPHNGAPILAWFEYYGETRIVMWEVMPDYSERGGWVWLRDDGTRPLAQQEPTAWQHLPAGP